jgi:ferrous iron transport protein B
LEYQAPTRHLTEKVDAILIHKVWGLAIFALVMAALFISIFSLADPLMSGIEAGVGAVGEFVAQWLPDGPIHDLWTDGIVAGVGAVVVFVPQIAMLFLFLAVLEDSGYLARAAFLMDRLLAKVGLHGKSFIPLLSSFACAIPGIMATRTIENRKDRLATIFVAPFMSCSARLPVYFLLIGTFFASFSPATRGGIMFSLYALGVIAAALTALIFKRTLLKGRPQAFILEMPTYKVPQLSQVARQVWVNTKAFVVKAGTIIFCLSVILWAMTYYPRLPAARKAAIEARAQRAQELRASFPREVQEWWSKHDDKEKVIASEQLRYSFAGRFGHLIEPLIRPLGYDW